MDINKKCYSSSQQHDLAEQLKSCEICKKDAVTYKEFVRNYEADSAYTHSEMFLLGLGALMVGALVGHQIK